MDISTAWIYPWIYPRIGLSISTASLEIAFALGYVQIQTSRTPAQYGIPHCRARLLTVAVKGAGVPTEEGTELVVNMPHPFLVIRVMSLVAWPIGPSRSATVVLFSASA